MRRGPGANPVQAGEAHRGLEPGCPPTKDPRAPFRRGVRSGMQELRRANPGLAGNEERRTVRPCPSPEGPEPVDLRVAPNELTGWRAAAGPFLRLWDAGVEHGTLSGAGPSGSEA